MAPAVEAAQPAPTEGTLHKPVVKPEDKAAKAEKKKKQTKQVVWKDDRVEKRWRTQDAKRFVQRQGLAYAQR